MRALQKGRGRSCVLNARRCRSFARRSYYRLALVCLDLAVSGIRDGPGKRKDEHSGPDEQTTEGHKVQTGHGGGSNGQRTAVALKRRLFRHPRMGVSGRAEIRQPPYAQHKHHTRNTTPRRRTTKLNANTQIRSFQSIGDGTSKPDEWPQVSAPTRAHRFVENRHYYASSLSGSLTRCASP